MTSVWHLPVATRPLVASRRPVCGVRQAVQCQARPISAHSSQQTETSVRAPKIQVPAALRPILAAVSANLLSTLPAHAEAGKIFDFNLTLPIMVTEFLLLMVFLDKFWFTPVGKNLDERDKYLREKLSNVKGNSSELDRLQKEAETAIGKARGEAGAAIAEARAAAQQQQQKELGEVKAKLDKELEQAIAQLEKEKDTAVSNLDQQVDKLTADILGRILPEGVKL